MYSPDALRTIATAAMDAARAAGAAYADIRCSDRRILNVGSSLPEAGPSPRIDFDVAFHVRARVGGAWASISGRDCTSDAAVQATRTATTTAKGSAAVIRPLWEMVPAPVVTGEWTTPVKIDPFDVTPDEHAGLFMAYVNVGQRLLDSHVIPHFVWEAETRVFASTEGSLVTQHLKRAVPIIYLQAETQLDAFRNGVLFNPWQGLRPCSAGFETIIGPEIQEAVKAELEDFKRLLRFPLAPLEDVGRFEAILDGASVGRIVGETLSPSLELRRVLGFDADGEGTSFLAPPDAILGQPLFSPQLTLTADRSMPHYGAAQWDDEGVATRTVPLITKGVVVDYCSTRATAGALASWYAKTKQPLAAQGTAVAWGPTRDPIGCASQLTITPGAAGTTVDTMTRQITNGVIVRSVVDVQSDPQLSGGAMWPNMVFEVKRGQITRRLQGVGVQFNTKSLWKNLKIVGDDSTTQNALRTRWLDPWVDKSRLPILAPAVLLSQLDLIRRSAR